MIEQWKKKVELKALEKGKKEEEKRIQKALDEYEEQLEELFSGFGGEDDELEFF